MVYVVLEIEFKVFWRFKEILMPRSQWVIVLFSMQTSTLSGKEQVKNSSPNSVVLHAIHHHMPAAFQHFTYMYVDKLSDIFIPFVSDVWMAVSAPGKVKG